MPASWSSPRSAPIACTIVVDLIVLYVLGVLGFLMRRFDIPVAPAVVGVILGPDRRRISGARSRSVAAIIRPS